MTPLPIDDALPALLDAIRSQGRAVLQAPPGAGKTTRVPLAMLDAKVTTGKIIMLEPRRLAARAAAERMADTLGEAVGHTVGYRMRGEAKTSKHTKIEVVTEGILTRMLQSDPELTNVGAVIFDEFHERSLNADLGLALTWEVRDALRDDLILLVMSATLDAEPVAKLLNNAPLVTSQGRSFPVDVRHRKAPLPKTTRLDQAVADQIRAAFAETTGGILVFLPGEGEIRQVQNRLSDFDNVYPLYGALPFAQQRAAIAADPQKRKIVLATSIAETALTIQDVKVVIDAGQSRRARYDPARGMSRLVTERVTRAEATQRSGRAGRVAPGISYRMWTKGEEGALAAFPPPEIAAADLAGLVLDLAQWGANPDDLAFLTPPPLGTWTEAQDLLRTLNALDTQNRITKHGRAIAAVPLHPRLAHMLLTAGPDAAQMAALLNERDPLRGLGVDLDTRLRALQDPRGHQAARGALDRIKQEAKRLNRYAKAHRNLSHAQQAALAYPDRIGLRRKGNDARYILTGGAGAVMPAQDPMGNQRLIVATDLDGAGRDAKIRQAITLSEPELRALYSEQIQWRTTCIWSKRDRKILARKQEHFGTVVLEDRRWDDAPADQIAIAMLDGIRDLGLPWSAKSRRLQARIELIRDNTDTLPDCTDDTLLHTIDDWLLPYLTDIKSAHDLKSLDLSPALKARITWDGEQLINRLAPAQFQTPLGRKIPLDYTSGTPEIFVRLQEMFGVTTHPTVGPHNTPLTVTLLSPAQRPVQTTNDLPNFWTSSYADVRKDMRGQYPKHPWPEDPTQADPTLKRKPRKS